MRGHTIALALLALVATAKADGADLLPHPSGFGVVVDARGKFVGHFQAATQSGRAVVLAKIGKSRYEIWVDSQYVETDGEVWRDPTKLVPSGQPYPKEVLYKSAGCTGPGFISPRFDPGSSPSVTTGDGRGSGYLYTAVPARPDPTEQTFLSARTSDTLCRDGEQITSHVIPVTGAIDLSTLYTAPYSLK